MKLHSIQEGLLLVELHKKIKIFEELLHNLPQLKLRRWI